MLGSGRSVTSRESPGRAGPEPELVISGLLPAASDDIATSSIAPPKTRDVEDFYEVQKVISYETVAAVSAKLNPQISSNDSKRRHSV